MNFNEYIDTHHAFASGDLVEACGGAASTHVALSRAVGDGRVSKVRTGLYVSNTGRFAGLAVDPYAVARSFAPHALFSFHSALELHGIAHSTSSRVQFRSGRKRLSFSFRGIDFERYPSRGSTPSDTVRAESFGEVLVTTREQMFVDCMEKTSLCGGTEEVLRSLAGLPYIDLDALAPLLERRPLSVSARAGWYLEENASRWHVPGGYLEVLASKLPRKASYYLDSTARRQARGWSSRWSLNLPGPLSELEEWMEL